VLGQRALVSNHEKWGVGSQPLTAGVEKLPQAYLANESCAARCARWPCGQRTTASPQKLRIFGSGSAQASPMPISCSCPSPSTTISTPQAVRPVTSLRLLGDSVDWLIGLQPRSRSGLSVQKHANKPSSGSSPRSRYRASRTTRVAIGKVRQDRSYRNKDQTAACIQEPSKASRLSAKGAA